MFLVYANLYVCMYVRMRIPEKKKRNLMAVCMSLLCIFTVINCVLYPIVDQRRNSFNIKKRLQPLLLSHLVDRASIYIKFEKDEVLQEYPFKIKFTIEFAFDCGGVCRDKFSKFWNEVYKKFFDSSSQLVPVLHPNVDILSFPKLGTILSHDIL